MDHIGYDANAVQRLCAFGEKQLLEFLSIAIPPIAWIETDQPPGKPGIHNSSSRFSPACVN